MNSLVLLGFGAIIFLMAYFNYGGFLNDLWGVNPKRIAPSYTKYDKKEYIPTKRKVLLSQHFGSIVGAGAIAGPIQAAIFGWVPVYLWIIIGTIFFGGVLDFASIYVSMRNNGKSIVSIIEESSGKLGKNIFEIASLAVIVFLISAFTSITSNAFEQVPGAATASAYFVIIAIIFGILVYKLQFNTTLSTIISIILVFFALILGYKYPFVKFSKETWYMILLAYAFLTSVISEWVVEPRDYLNSFITYALIIASIAGLIITKPYTQLKPIINVPVTTKAGILYLFPMLFTMISCGAISGFHSIITSSFTSKRIENEKDIRSIGYGSMLLEGFVGIIALLSVVCAQNVDKVHVDLNTAPVQVFSQGIGNILGSLKIPEDFAIIFATFAFSALALSGINTAMRATRYTFDEISKNNVEKKKINIKYYIISLTTILVSGIFLNFGYQKIWILFGTANEALATLTLTSISIWFLKSNKKILPAIVPMILIACISLSTFFIMGYNFIQTKDYFLFGLILLITLLPVYPIYKGISSMIKIKKEREKFKILPKNYK